MSKCQEVGVWIEEKVLKPVERLIRQVVESCEEVGRWVEESVLEPLETIQTEQQERCEQKKCWYLCLCCNKWVCWIEDVLITIIIWVTRVIFVWLVELICKLIVIIVSVIVWVLVTVLKWIIVAIVCILERICEVLLRLMTFALILILIGVVMLFIPSLASSLVSVWTPAIATFLSVFFVGIAICKWDRCQLLRHLVWALKWAIAVGALLAINFIAAKSALVVVVYGGVVAWLITWMEKLECKVPRLLSLP